MGERTDVLADRMSALRTAVRSGDPDAAFVAFAQAIYTIHATPGCERQGVRVADLYHLAERVRETADWRECINEGSVVTPEDPDHV